MKSSAPIPATFYRLNVPFFFFDARGVRRESFIAKGGRSKRLPPSTCLDAWGVGPESLLAKEGYAG